MNAMVPASFGKLAPQFAGQPIENDLAAGIEASYGIMKYKGKVWSTSYKGQENRLMRADGDGPRNSIDVVIVKAPKVKSKIFYAAGYTEGSTAAPDCWSTNGVTPDPQAPHKQHGTCMGCPMDAWGSRTTEAGKKGKRCGDSKRVAIVPADAESNNPGILRNEFLGGPMLLRIPAATLATLAAYGDMMAKAGFPYAAVITRISFDPAEAYPTFKFAPVRPLTPEEAEVIVELAASTQVDRILAESGAPADVEALPAPTVTFAAPLPGQEVKAPSPTPPPPPAAPPAAPPVVPVAPPVAPPAPPPAPAQVTPVVTSPVAAPVVTGFGPAVAVSPEPTPTAAAPAPAPAASPAIPADLDAALDAILTA